MFQLAGAGETGRSSHQPSVVLPITPGNKHIAASRREFARVPPKRALQRRGRESGERLSRRRYACPNAQTPRAKARPKILSSGHRADQGRGRGSPCLPVSYAPPARRHMTSTRVSQMYSRPPTSAREMQAKTRPSSTTSGDSQVRPSPASPAIS